MQAVSLFCPNFAPTWKEKFDDCVFLVPFEQTEQFSIPVKCISNIHENVNFDHKKISTFF